jgi:hypothetical protein
MVRTAERIVMANMLLRFGRGATRLFRINSGVAWVGKVLSHEKGLIVLDNPRPFHGAPAGSSDLIGWHSIVITPEMVGQRVAVFVAVEVKAERRQATPEQAAFTAAVQRAGGVATVARTEDEVAAALARAGGVDPKTGP